jgi:hypothetical protein
MVDHPPNNVPAKTEQQSSSSNENASTENQDPFATKSELIGAKGSIAHRGRAFSPDCRVLPSVRGYEALAA